MPSDLPPVPQVDPPVQQPQVDPPVQQPVPEPQPEPVPEPQPGPVPELQPEPLEPAAKPRQTPEERIAAVRARARAAEEEARYWRERALVAQPAQPEPAPRPDPEPARPTRDAFQNPDDYDAALVSWAADLSAHKVRAEERQRESERQATAARETQERAGREEIVRLENAWNERRSKFIADHPDFVEVAEGDHPVSDAMAMTIKMAENGPEIAYYLGEHPEEAARIAAMTRGVYTTGPHAGLPAVDLTGQIFEMGKIAAKLAAPAPQRPTAPAPITPVRATNGAAGRRQPSEMSTEEYAVYYREREKARRMQ